MYELAGQSGASDLQDGGATGDAGEGTRAGEARVRVLERRLARATVRIHHLREQVQDLKDLNETLEQHLKQASFGVRRARAVARRGGNGAEDGRGATARVSAAVLSELVTLLHMVAHDVAGLKQSRPDDGGGELPQVASLERLAARLIGRAADLRDLLKIETETFRPAFSAVNVNRFVEHVAERVGPHLEAEHIVLVTELAPGLPETWLDRERMETVVLHFLLNAAKVTSRYGRIRLTTGGSDREVAISVEDEGPGLPRERVEALMRMFSGASGSAARRARSGLGLLLARAIVDLHGGRIEVASEFGRGTRFTVRLPAGRGALDQGARRGLTGRPTGFDASTRTSEFKLADFSGIRGMGVSAVTQGALPSVLVVDPSSSALYLAVLHLRSRCNVLTARGSGEALRLLSERSADLVIADLGLEADQGGLALCRAIKEGRGGGRVPVILTSEQADAEVIRRAIEVGADGFLAKPFVAAELLECVSRWVPSSRTRAAQASPDPGGPKHSS